MKTSTLLSSLVLATQLMGGEMSCEAQHDFYVRFLTIKVQGTQNSFKFNEWAGKWQLRKPNPVVGTNRTNIEFRNKTGKTFGISSGLNRNGQVTIRPGVTRKVYSTNQVSALLNCDYKIKEIVRPGKNNIYEFYEKNL